MCKSGVLLTDGACINSGNTHTDDRVRGDSEDHGEARGCSTWLDPFAQLLGCCLVPVLGKKQPKGFCKYSHFRLAFPTEGKEPSKGTFFSLSLSLFLLKLQKQNTGKNILLTKISFMLFVVKATYKMLHYLKGNRTVLFLFKSGAVN